MSCCGGVMCFGCLFQVARFNRGNGWLMTSFALREFCGGVGVKLVSRVAR